MSFCLSGHPSVSLFVCLSVCLSVFLLYLSVSLFVCLSACLSVSYHYYTIFPLADALKEKTDNVQLGFGTFVDKTVDPYVNMAK